MSVLDEADELRKRWTEEGPLPSCSVCQGACCESLVLPPGAISDPGWAEARGIRFHATGQAFPAWEVPCPCPKLSGTGSCTIYDTRPQTCRAYPVGGSGCLAAIRRRRTPERQREIFGGRTPWWIRGMAGR